MVRIEQASLVDLAASKIRELILAGAIKPGEWVRKEWLTARLGISPPPRCAKRCKSWSSRDFWNASPVVGCVRSY